MFNSLLDIIQTRQHTAPKRLIAPGPSEDQLQSILMAASCAPDHGRITPWRFVIIEKRERLADAFAQSLQERDPQASAEQFADARSKAFRAPCLILAIAKLQQANEKISDSERWISLGCAIQNILLMAQSMNLGSGLSSGQALASPALRKLFALEENEQAACFISIGTVSEAKPPHPRLALENFIQRL